jgi:hypothetical protein
MMVSMASYSRSNRRCKLQKLLTIYFKSCGLGAKAFDTLHALGITMSQKWGYSGIETLSEAAHKAILADTKKYPWFGVHDNINLGFKVYEQRLSNQSHFDSGTAATIVVIKDPTCKPPSSQSAREKFVEGAKHPISYLDIVKLDDDASPRLTALAVHKILQILTHSPQFDFETYEHHNHNIFSRPSSTLQLPVGPDYASCQYMLDTVHIEEASYEGNDRVLKEWFRQLDLDSPAEQKRIGEESLIVWAGDQLTVSRIRGLKKFRCEDLNSYERMEHIRETIGWFHAQIALEHSLHTQYYGTRAGLGLVHAFDLLNRKGLNSPTVQGVFHHNLKEGLLHISTARFRDLWCVVAGVDSLKDLQARSPEELLALATHIVRTFASARALQALDDKPTNERDDVLTQSVQWNKDILDYLILDEAMKIGDVGCMKDLLPRLLFRFAGGPNSNYAIEILELMQGLYREWPSDLTYVFVP